MTLTHMIKRHGQELTLRKSVSEGTYNPATGSVSGATTEDYTVLGYFYNYDIEEIDGTSVLRGDRKLLLYTKDIVGEDLPEPESNDKVLGSGDTVSVISVRKILSGSTVRCYILQVRE